MANTTPNATLHFTRAACIKHDVAVEYTLVIWNRHYREYKPSKAYCKTCGVLFDHLQFPWPNSDDHAG